MILTQHAIDRWQERLPDVNLEIEYITARRAGKRAKKKLRKMCPYHKEYISSTYKGYYYLLSKNGIVFVMTPPEIVVTCFRCENF